MSVGIQLGRFGTAHHPLPSYTNATTAIAITTATAITTTIIINTNNNNTITTMCRDHVFIAIFSITERSHASGARAG